MASKISQVNWEKVGVYIALFAGLLTIFGYLMDCKERIAKVEVKIEHLEKKP